MSVYLDFNSSAPIDPRVLDFMVSIYKGYAGNADSRTHDFGENARKVVENARKQVAGILKIDAGEVFFTSGATESDNIALLGLRDYGIQSGKKHIITTSIEHKAVLGAAKKLAADGFEVEFVDPDMMGRVSAEEIIKKIRDDTLLVSMMHVNNETGVIQPVFEVGQILSERHILFHVDATQSFGKLVEELQVLKYDMMSMSAHKLGGPQGVGALILRKKKHKLPPVKNITYGGQQEHGIRPGTIPVALVAALGKACELAQAEYAENSVKCLNIKLGFINLLKESGVSYHINGDQDHCVPNTLNVCFDGVSSEALMLSVRRYCGISNGSACNSNSYEPSYVLQAMGLPVERIESSVRISWGAETDRQAIENAIEKLLCVVKALAP